jgi:hypothetical protein
VLAILGVAAAIAARAAWTSRQPAVT